MKLAAWRKTVLKARPVEIDSSNFRLRVYHFTTSIWFITCNIIVKDTQRTLKGPAAYTHSLRYFNIRALSCALLWPSSFDPVPPHTSWRSYLSACGRLLTEAIPTRVVIIWDKAIVNTEPIFLHHHHRWFIRRALRYILSSPSFNLSWLIWWVTNQPLLVMSLKWSFLKLLFIKEFAWN